MRAAVSGRAVTGHDPRARRSSGIVARTSLDLRLVPLDVPSVRVYGTYMDTVTNPEATMRLPIEDFARIEHIFGAYDLGGADAIILSTRRGQTHIAIERDGETSSSCSLDDWTPETFGAAAA